MRHTTMIILFIVISFAVVISVGLKIESKDRVRQLRRIEFCDTLCVMRNSSVYMVVNQRIGFGSTEPRCYCHDGSWRPVP